MKSTMMERVGLESGMLPRARLHERLYDKLVLTTCFLAHIYKYPSIYLSPGGLGASKCCDRCVSSQFSFAFWLLAFQTHPRRLTPIYAIYMYAFSFPNTPFSVTQHAEISLSLSLGILHDRPWYMARFKRFKQSYPRTSRFVRGESEVFMS